MKMECAYCLPCWKVYL